MRDRIMRWRVEGRWRRAGSESATIGQPLATASRPLTKSTPPPASSDLLRPPTLPPPRRPWPTGSTPLANWGPPHHTQQCIPKRQPHKENQPKILPKAFYTQCYKTLQYLKLYISPVPP